MLLPTERGPWYLGEDYAFCERARQCDISIVGDTRIRLGHIGNYTFHWEEAGTALPRYATFHYHLNDPEPASSPPAKSRPGSFFANIAAYARTWSMTRAGCTPVSFSFRPL
jgi:hypothetical protein